MKKNIYLILTLAVLSITQSCEKSTDEKDREKLGEALSQITPENLEKYKKLFNEFEKIEVEWRCEQTQETTVPVSKMIKIDLPIMEMVKAYNANDTEAITKLYLKSSDFEDVLKKTKNSGSSKYDFSNCAMEFMQKTRDRVETICHTLYEWPNFASSVKNKFHSFINGCEMYAGGMLRELDKTEIGFFKTGWPTKLPPYEAMKDPVGGISEEDLESLEDTILGCGLFSGNYQDPRLLSSSFLNRLVGKMKEDGPGLCQKSLESIFLNLLESLRPAQRYCKVTLNSDDCMASRNLNILEALNLLDEAQILSDSTRDHLLKLQIGGTCGNYSKQIFLEDIKEFYFNYLDSLTCSPLKAGEVKIANGFYHSKVKSTYAYRLSLEKENQIDIIFNIKFKKQEHEDLAKKCLEMTKDQFKGAHGKSLKLMTLDQTSLSTAPPQVRIDFLNEGSRSHSKAWSLDIDCPTVIHELLHLLGLVDEYNEKWTPVLDSRGKKIGDEDNCRAAHFTGTNNIMSSQYSLFYKNVDSMSGRFCYCPSALKDPSEFGLSIDDEQECQESLKSMSKYHSTCPTAASSLYLPNMGVEQTELIPDSYYSNFKYKDQILDFLKKPENLRETLNNSMLLTYSRFETPDKEKNSLLKQEQFNLISSPECLSKNLRYKKCSKEAYKTYFATNDDDDFSKKKCDPIVKTLCHSTKAAPTSFE